MARTGSTAFHRREKRYIVSLTQPGGGIRAAAVDEQDRLDGGRGPERGEHFEQVMAPLRGGLAVTAQRAPVSGPAAVTNLLCGPQGSQDGSTCRRR